MQSVNDDMDELFRKAAKDYPLETGSADWDKVVGQLSKRERQLLFRRYDKKLLWLLLLIPFSFICNEYFVDADQSRMAVNKNIKAPNKSVADKNSLSKTNKNNKAGPATNVAPKFKAPGSALYPINSNEQQTGRVVSKRNTKQTEETAVFLTDHTEPGLFHNDPGFYNKTSPYFKRNYTQIPYVVKYPSLMHSVKAQPHQAIASVADKESSRWEKPDKRFYAGIVGSLDATSIQFQRIDNPGYDIGILLGYKIHKKWSIEAGLSLDKKYYYTKGEYFNTSKIRAFMPPNSEIASVNGNCQMWEIPLSLRYELKTTSKHTLSASAGISSYLMNRESYNYLYYYPASGQSWEYYKSYPSSSKHLFSVVQLAAGYTVKLHKVGDLRLEPYMKLPLKGMGVGSIHLQSAGLHVSITKQVF